jgi:hypothetical protein
MKRFVFAVIPFLFTASAFASGNSYACRDLSNTNVVLNLKALDSNGPTAMSLDNVASGELSKNDTALTFVGVQTGVSVYKTMTGKFLTIDWSKKMAYINWGPGISSAYNCNR